MNANGRHISPGGAFAALLATAAAALLLAPAAPVTAQTSAATKTFANEQYRYSVALPAGCRHEEGPGTIDAVCSADLDPEQSAQVSNANALVMEVGAEIVTSDAAKTVAELAQTYPEPSFVEELPEAVCGKSDKARAKIANVKQTTDASRTHVYC